MKESSLTIRDTDRDASKTKMVDRTKVNGFKEYRKEKANLLHPTG